MHTQTFKVFNYLFLTFIAFGFSGCVEYYNQICTDSNIRDIRGLQGTKASTMFDPGSNEAVGTKFEVVRRGRGQYRIDQLEFRTCKVAGRTIAEFKLPSGNFSAKEILMGRYGQYSEAPLVIGKSTLKKLGIPFKFEVRASASRALIPNSILKNPKLQKYLKKLEEPAPESKVMVIMNKTRKHNKQLVQNFRPVFLGFSYQ